MRQMIHIFRKDVRRLWPALAIALALQALFTFYEMRPHERSLFITNRVSPETVVDFLLPLAWWYLIAVLVHEEPLAGDRQFWITRPYSWQSLLAAKIVFILVFVNLPVLIADCFILPAQGFSVGVLWKAMLWRQIPFSTWVLLPPLALGSLTRNLGQVVLAILLIVLRIVVASLPLENGISPGSTAVSWIADSIENLLLLGVLFAVIFIQYRYRRTLLAGTVLAAFVLLPGVPIPLRWQLDWQARMKPSSIPTSAIRIALDPTRGRRMPLNRLPRTNEVDAVVPIAVSGVPEGFDVVSTLAELNIAGKAFSEQATIERDNQGYWQTIRIPAKIFQSMEHRVSTFRISPVVTVVRYSEFRVPLETGPVRIPAVGICESVQPAPEILQVFCRSALRSPARTRVHADYPGWETSSPSRRPREQFIGVLSESPFPAELGLSPVHTLPVFSLGGPELTRALSYPGTELIFDTQHPVAHFRTEFDVPSARLDDYLISEPE